MKQAFSITVEKNIYDWAKAFAESESRTLSNYIEYLIRKDKEAAEDRKKSQLLLDASFFKIQLFPKL